MRVLKLDIQGFGCLKGSYVFSPAGVNLVVAPNETGKTTLVEAMREALYGPLKADRKTRSGLALGQHEPADGGPFALTLEVEIDGKKLAIVRDFKAGTAVVYADGEDMSEAFRVGKDRLEIGEKLLGLDRDEFSKTVFVGQGELELVRDGESLTEVLQRLADAEGGDGTAAGALGAIDQVLQRYPLATTGDVNTKNERKRLNDRLEDARARRQVLSARRDALSGEAQALDALSTELKALESRLAVLAVVEKQAAYGEALAALADDDEQAVTVRGLEAELASLADAADFPIAERDTVDKATRAIDGARERRATALEERARLNRSLTDLRREIDLLGAVGTFTDSDVAALRAVLDRLARARDSERDITARLEAEERRLQDEGLAPERAAALVAELKPLGVEDRAFLRSVEAQRGERTARAQAEEETLSDCAARVRRIDDERRHRGRAAWAALAAGVALAATAAVLFLLEVVEPTLAAGLASPALLVLVYGAVRLVGVSRARADERKDASLRGEEAAREKDRLRLAAEEEGRKLATLSARLPARAPEDLPVLLAEVDALAARTEPHRRLKELEAERGREAEEAVASAYQLLARAGRPETTPVEEALRLLAADAARSLGLARDLAAAELRLREVERLLGEEAGRIAEAEKSLGAALARAGIDSTLPAAEVRERFAAGAARALRHQQVVEQELPRERGRRLDAARRAKLEGEREALRLDLETKGIAAAPPRELTSENVRRERDSAASRREHLAAELTGRRLRAGGEYDAVRRDLPTLESQIEEFEIALRRLDAFEEAAHIARDTLKGLGVAVHALWAEALNRHAADAFAAILPHYVEPRFDPSLRLSFRSRDGQRRLSVGPKDEELRMSAGTLDQIYLIARFAVARYLSRGDAAAPMFLDDPFVTSDDERFRAGMKLLVERLAQDRQVILLTCHRARHEWLVREEPALAGLIRPVALS